MVGLAIGIAEGQVFKLPLQVTNTQAMGQRGIDVEHFTRDALLVGIVGTLEHPHGDGAFGELDECHPHVIDHGDQHAANVHVRGHGLPQHRRIASVRQVADRRHAQHAVEQAGHLPSKFTANRLHINRLLAYRPVQEAGEQCITAQAQLGQDLNDLQPHSQGLRLPRPIKGATVLTVAPIAQQMTGRQQSLPVGGFKGGGKISKPLGQTLPVQGSRLGQRSYLNHPQAP